MAIVHQRSDRGQRQGDIHVPAWIHDFVASIVPDVDGEPDALIADRGAVPVPTVGTGVVIPKVMPTAVVPGVELDVTYPTLVIAGLGLDGQRTGADDSAV